MPSTAGNLLLRAGLITSQELAQASAAATKSGGQVGEELIRAGVIHEVTLVDFFHHRLMIQRTPTERLDKIDPKVIAQVPADMAVEFRLMPVELDGEGAIVIAMADPSDTHAVDEVRFFTDRFVVRTVAATSEIRRALVSYYGANLPQLPDAKRAPVTDDDALPIDDSEPVAPVRGMRRREHDPDRTPLPEPRPLGDSIPPPRPPVVQPAGKRPAATPPGPAPPPPQEPLPTLLETPVLLTKVKSRAGEITIAPPAPPVEVSFEADPHSTQTTQLSSDELLAHAAAAEAEAEALEIEGRRRIDTLPIHSPTALTEDTQRPTDRMPAYVPPPELDPDEPILLTRPIKTERKRTTLTGAQGPAPAVPLAAIRIASSRDEVASLMLDYVAQLCRRSLLMVIRKGQLVGFAARGDDAPRLAQLSLPLDAPTLLRDVIVSRLPYRGPLPITEENDRFADALGGVGAEVLVMPITIRDKLIALLYADSPLRAMPDSELHAVTREVGLAFERLILEKRPT